MNKAQSHRISFDSRSAGLAQVCLALVKTDSKAARQCHNQGKAIGGNFNRHPLGILPFARCHARPGCAMIQSP
jgi:hypothetical protein